MAEADIARDRDRLLEVLARNFEPWGDGEKFDWLYSTNPFGRARVWVLEDETGKWVGLSAAFPRRLRAGGRILEAWVLGDFCVDRELRALGPAIALQRAVCEAVNGGEADVWYDFPSRSMTAVYGRMGLRPSGEFVRMVRPLRVDRKVAEKLDDGLLGKSVAFVGTSLLTARDLMERRDRSIEVQTLEEDLEAVRDLRSEGDGVELDRTVDYLRWRYRSAPRESASILLARREGKAVGGIVFRHREQDVAIVDILGIAEESVLRELVREVVEAGRSRKADRVVIALSSSHRWIGAFERLGFSKRDSAPYFVYPRPGALDAGSPWSLTSGDRDL